MKRFNDVMQEMRKYERVRIANPSWDGATYDHLDVHEGGYNKIGYAVTLNTDFKPVDVTDPECRKGQFQNREWILDHASLEDAVIYALAIAKEKELPVYFQKHQSAKYLDPHETGDRKILYHPKDWVPNHSL